VRWAILAGRIGRGRGERLVGSGEERPSRRFLRLSSRRRAVRPRFGITGLRGTGPPRTGRTGIGFLSTMPTGLRRPRPRWLQPRSTRPGRTMSRVRTLPRCLLGGLGLAGRCPSRLLRRTPRPWLLRPRPGLVRRHVLLLNCDAGRSRRSHLVRRCAAR
jgi:hypothetical protein